MSNTINPLKSIPFWVIIISVLLADVFSKYAVFEWLENKPNQHVELIGKYIAFSKHINEGAVWGIASGKYIFLVVVKIAVMGFIIVIAQKTHEKFKLIALALIFGGACGNLYDRLFTQTVQDGKIIYGVRDFIDIGVSSSLRWPVFNIADITIVIGVILFTFCSLWKSKRKE